MKYKYGEFSENQMQFAKNTLQKRIFFLLLLVDKKTSDKYEGVDVLKTFDSLLTEFGSLNNLLGYPAEMVSVLSLVNAAKLEYESSDFSWPKYRKLILDAGSEVEKIQVKEV